MLLNKNLYKVIVTIEDKGETFKRTEEVICSNNKNIKDETQKQFKKIRTSLGLSTKFKITNYEVFHIGMV